MKKLVFFFVALFVSMTVFAGRPTGFTPGGGAIMDWSKATATSLSKNSQTDYFWGYYLEAGYTFKFSKASSLFAGLRAAEAFNSNAYDVISNRASAAYLERKIFLDIPVKYNFNFDISPKVQMYISAGPTVDFWLGYSATAVTTDRTTKVSSRINYFKEYSDSFNRVNIGLGGALGVFFYNVKIEVGYDQYLLDSYKINGIKGSRGQLRVGAAYVF